MNLSPESDIVRASGGGGVGESMVETNPNKVDDRKAADNVKEAKAAKATGEEGLDRSSKRALRKRKAKGVAGTDEDKHRMVSSRIRLLEPHVEAYINDINKALRSRGLDQSTPLHVAASSAEPDLLRALTEVYWVNATGEEGATPLMCAVYDGRADCARVLIEKGADVNAMLPTGKSSLILACQKGHEDLVDLLLESGADVDGIGRDGTMSASPIYLAAYWRRFNIVRTLVANGAAVNAKGDINGLTALHLAAMDGDAAMAKALLEAGAFVNVADRFGDVPIHSAVAAGNLEVTRLLIEHGADVNVAETKDRKWTPLHVAAMGENADLVELLIDAGAVVDANRENGVSALHLTLQHNAGKHAIRLLSAGARVDSRAVGGWTPLHIDVVFNRGALSETLLAAGADADARTSVEMKEISPLNIAAETGIADVAARLVLAGADAGAVGWSGLTPLQLSLRDESLEELALAIYEHEIKGSEEVKAEKEDQTTEPSSVQRSSASV